MELSTAFTVTYAARVACGEGEFSGREETFERSMSTEKRRKGIVKPSEKYAPESFAGARTFGVNATIVRRESNRSKHYFDTATRIFSINRAIDGPGPKRGSDGAASGSSRPESSPVNPIRTTTS